MSACKCCSAQFMMSFILMLPGISFKWAHIVKPVSSAVRGPGLQTSKRNDSSTFPYELLFGFFLKKIIIIIKKSNFYSNLYTVT